MASPASPFVAALRPDSPDFSLVLGGPLYQLLRRAHMTGNALELMRRAAGKPALGVLLGAEDPELWHAGAADDPQRKVFASLHPPEPYLAEMRLVALALAAGLLGPAAAPAVAAITREPSGIRSPRMPSG